ncbi:hypothetical protein GCM10007103_33610 [Salinimicrobium marinum]|uniref:Uncharacterized protein n=1 Tax=Salinimicrobium marinum TaxID=680283 RepID=A0A918SKL0_9FLAO|nr:hypothetical protein [Salinimicrobium marinum]GHA50079.1 hypothetical protein GCM10007103_33610 [Salinimicrobium marinum]
MASTLKTKDLDFVILKFHENFVISELKDGVLLEQKKLNRLIKICTDFYKEKRFIYISKRINNYNVNPVVYLNLKEVKNLGGIAIVCSHNNCFSTASFEKNFSKIPFEVFLDFEEAVKWAEDLLKK